MRKILFVIGAGLLLALGYLFFTPTFEVQHAASLPPLEEMEFVGFGLTVGPLDEESVTISPDRERIAFATLQGGAMAIFVYDIAANQAHAVSGIVGEKKAVSWGSDGQLFVSGIGVFGCQDSADACVLRQYQSVDVQTPWVVEEQNR